MFIIKRLVKSSFKKTNFGIELEEFIDIFDIFEFMTLLYLCKFKTLKSIFGIQLIFKDDYNMIITILQSLQ